MFIETDAPFQITPEQDATLASQDQIQVSVAHDVGAFKINHRVGSKPHGGQQSRWLHVNLSARGLHIFVRGTHVVVTARDRLPTFDLVTPEQWLDKAMSALRADKDEAGRYVVDTPGNRAVLKELFERVQDAEKNRLLAWIKYLIASALK